MGINYVKVSQFCYGRQEAPGFNLNSVLKYQFLVGPEKSFTQIFRIIIVYA